MKKAVIISLALIGVTAISSQIMLLRELLTVFYGNEISIGFMLAVWLVSGALGSGVFGRLLVRAAKDKALLFAGFQVLAAFLIPASVIFSRVIRLAFGATPGEILGIPALLSWSALVLSPLCIVLGILFVLGCAIYVAEDPAKKIGSTYILEAAGSTIGGVVTSLVLIRLLDSMQIAAILSFSNLAACFYMTVSDRGPGPFFWKKSLRAASFLLFALLLLFAGTGGLGRVERETMKLKWKGLGLIEVRNSVYGRNVVTGEEGQVSFFASGLHMFTAPDALTAEETVHFPMLSHPGPENVLLIGGGISEVTAEILKYPVKRLDYVELDPQVVELARIYLGGEPYYGLDDSRVFVINEDARFYVSNTENRYDVCIINLPNPYTAQINRFYTAEFFRNLKGVLHPGAVVSFTVSSSENYISREQARFLATLYATAKSEFADVKVLPGDTAHFLLSDREGLLKTGYKYFDEEIRKRGVKTSFVNEYYLFAKLSDERVAYLKDALSRVPSPRLNLDFRPVSYYYDMILWGAYFSADFSKFFDVVNERTIIYASFALFLAVIVFSLVLTGKKGARRQVVILALGTTGFSEISFQMFIILAFQVLYGYLYYKLGMIVTSFMIGLSVGSIYIVRRLDAIRDHYNTYIKVQGLVCLYPLALLAVFLLLARPGPARALWLGTNIVFVSLPFIAGFVGGVQFPLANKICLMQDPSVGRSAGVTYAVDLFGSCVGALLISAFIVPVIGIAGACGLVFLLNLSAMLALLWGRFTLAPNPRSEATSGLGLT